MQLLKSKYKIFNCTMIFTMTNPRYHDAELDEPWLDLKKTRRLDSLLLTIAVVWQHQECKNIAEHPRAEDIQRGSAAAPRHHALHGGPKEPLQQIQGQHEGQHVCVLQKYLQTTCRLPQFS